MKRPPHSPVRCCIGCGGRSQQRQMVRLVRDRSGQLVIDLDRRAGGRGGYLHRAEACWVAFARRKGLVRSLGAQVDPPARLALIAQLEVGVGR